MNEHLKRLVWTLAAAAVVAVGGSAGCGPKKDGAAKSNVVEVPAGSFARAWFNDLKLDRDPVARMHAVGNTLFVYTRGHLAYALGRSGGELMYLAQPTISGGVLRAPVLLPGDRVAYPSGSTIEIMNTRGRPVRTMTLDKPTRSGAVASGNTLFIGLDHTGGTGVISSLSTIAQYRLTNWELMTFGAVSPTPALFERVIYCGDEAGRINAVTEERAPVWSLPNGKNWFETQGRFVSDIKADETGVYASNTDSKLYCLDRATGRIKWQYYASAALRDAPVVMGTLVYQFVPGTGIVAIDKLQGQYSRQPKWIVKEATQFLSEDEPNVYLRARDNRILAVEKASGNVVFRSKSRDFTAFAPNQEDSTIFAATRDGRITAIRPVLNIGEVGTMVREFRFEPVASR